MTITSPEITYSPRLTTSDIQFHALSATEWRVSDRRHPKESIDALLGFVAQKGDFYYATRMRHPLEMTPLSSLDRVADYFAAPDTPPALPGIPA